MSAVIEIESAIKRLTDAELEELANWLDKYCAMNNAAANIGAMYDSEESTQGKSVAISINEKMDQIFREIPLRGPPKKTKLGPVISQQRKRN